MNIIKILREKASKNLKTIVFPRSSDPRVIRAAEYLKINQLCHPILLTNKDSLKSSVDMINIENSPKLDEYAASYYERRKYKGITFDEAFSTVNNPLYFAASMIASDHAHGGVAGSISSTSDVLKAAIQTIGLKKGSRVVSSIFLMSFEDDRVLSYGDCAVVPYPNAEQLATIAIDSAETHTKLTGELSKVALLSFSTKGSAQHERVDLVKNAYHMVRINNPELEIDGELQFDAAYVESIGLQKAPTSKVAGNANVFIFPNLDAGNISYKITQRLVGATATGPIIQGLDKPMMDLSRGCSWEDIVNVACVASLLSN